MAKVLISIREEFLEKIDELAEDEQRSRSELIRQALRVYMRRRGGLSNTPFNANAHIVESILFD
ncbi:MAG: ribbon-helix-helix domain-containing protein [Vampirovibrio sp.]|nr:ribbon-helix-helix domain-containing protein [Vampirovibrio sp.]